MRDSRPSAFSSSRPVVASRSSLRGASSVLVVLLLSPCACDRRAPRDFPATEAVLSPAVERLAWTLSILATGPDGRIWGAEDRTLHVVSADGRSLRAIRTFGNPITSVHVTPAGHLLIATDRDTSDSQTLVRVHLSTDGGERFRIVHTLRGVELLWWSLASNEAGTFFVGEYGPKDDDATKAVWRSRDAGEHWTRVFETADARGAHVHRVACDPYTREVWVTVGDGRRRRGVFRSRDEGDSWERVADSQATGIAFGPRAVWLGEDEAGGVVSRLDRESGRRIPVFRARDRGDYGGSIYDLLRTPRGTIYAPALQYPGQEHTAGLWAGRGDHWKLIVRLASEAGGASGFQTIAGPDAGGWVYVRGYRIHDERLVDELDAGP